MAGPQTFPKGQDLFQKGLKLLRSGWQGEARAALLEAAEQAASNANLLEEIARALEDVGDREGAVRIYKRALLANSDRFLAHARLGSLLFAQGQTAAAIFHLERAHELNPDDAAVLNNLGLFYQANREIDRSIETLKRALEKGGPEDLIKGSLAGLYEETNRLEDLKALLAESLPKFPNDYYLNFVAAKLKRREGELEGALKHLLQFDSSMLANDEQVVYHFELGRIYNSIKDYDRAFAHFETGNRLSAHEPSFKSFSKDKSRESIRNFEALDLSSWKGAPSEPPVNGAPVFLVGFPRSGTTLLNQILDGHPGIEVLEEEPTLARLAANLSSQGGVFPKILETIEPETLAQLRGLYSVYAESLRKKEGNCLLIDKFPLQILEVPFILKLFPNAKIILALRHPCDVVLSCFMQNFGPNNAMLNFLTPDDATAYYAAVMGLWLKYQKELPLNVHTVRYENVVENLEGQARELIGFLGLPWDERVLAYRDQALAKTRINTPSYHQVIKPIYSDALGRWKHYEKFLKPYTMRLEPFVKTFGYEL